MTGDKAKYNQASLYWESATCQSLFLQVWNHPRNLTSNIFQINCFIFPSMTSTPASWSSLHPVQIKAFSSVSLWWNSMKQGPKLQVTYWRSHSTRSWEKPRKEQRPVKDIWLLRWLPLAAERLSLTGALETAWPMFRVCSAEGQKAGALVHQLVVFLLGWCYSPPQSHKFSYTSDLILC